MGVRGEAAGNSKKQIVQPFHSVQVVQPLRYVQVVTGERLCVRGYAQETFIGGNFNVDDVLIGPGGVFTVETKTHSKPSGDARVVFDGETIRIDGFEPDRDRVIQATAQASCLRELLAESTGCKFEVKSANCFSWLVCGKERVIWVLNPKGVDHEHAQLSREDIQLASLKRTVRSHYKLEWWG